MQYCPVMPRRGVLSLLPVPIAPTAQVTVRGCMPLPGLLQRTGIGHCRTEGWFMPSVNARCVHEHEANAY
eukprot:scaffold17531_cov241-Isochrysis_galbana.AAC.7